MRDILASKHCFYPIMDVNTHKNTHSHARTQQQSGGGTGRPVNWFSNEWPESMCWRINSTECNKIFIDTNINN